MSAVFEASAIPLQGESASQLGGSARSGERAGRYGPGETHGQAKGSPSPPREYRLLRPAGRFGMRYVSVRGRRPATWPGGEDGRRPLKALGRQTRGCVCVKRLALLHEALQ